MLLNMRDYIQSSSLIASFSASLIALSGSGVGLVVPLLGGSVAIIMDKNSWTISAAAIPVISAWRTSQDISKRYHVGRETAHRDHKLVPLLQHLRH